MSEATCTGSCHTSAEARVSSVNRGNISDTMLDAKQTPDAGQKSGMGTGGRAWGMLGNEIR
ncbi:hypothetical protein Q5P01_010878 [Channa striata]|uniref:Uncharacterized protein n=1 Tax=Channa striata TaxID=64152 RepID=A0AA88MTA4_CHASR|nr:hypothetical protein Q5P01_010878 [Channa striata]